MSKLNQSINSVNFYQPGSIPHKNIRYVTAVGKYKNEWVLIKKHKSNVYEFPGGKKKNEKLENTLKREIKEEIGSEIIRAIPLTIYSFPNTRDEYGLLYYCEFSKPKLGKNHIEVSEISLNSAVSDLNRDHAELFKFVENHRQVQNPWFYLDTRKTFGRTGSITINGKTKKIKKGIADPMDITKTFKGFFEGYLKGELKGPIQLDLNPTSVCSDSCVFCFNQKDRAGDTSMIDYQKTIESISSLCETTNLMHVKSSGFGDPIFYPKIWDIFKFCKEKGLVTSLNTNGKTVYKNFDQVLQYLDCIRFSVDAWGEEQFRMVHNANDFLKRKESFEQLARLRELKRPDLVIGLHYVVLPINLSGIEPMIKWAIKNKIDYIDITLDKFIPTYINKWNRKFIDKAIAKIKGFEKYISPDFNIIFPAIITTNKEKLAKFRGERYNSNPCWQIYLRQYITPAGEYGSCNAFESQPIKKRVFGNINTDSMKSISKKIVQGSVLVEKNNECSYCVIPHGIFNDLADFVYNNMK